MVTRKMKVLEFGQIFKANQKLYPEAFHPIVFFGPSPERKGFFIGGMLTSVLKKGNIRMDERHFSKEFVYYNTHIVGVALLKPNDWKMEIDLGRLSPEGIEFVKEKVSFKNIRTWEEHFQ